jgi:F-type H+-transporting ATPase subunit gamma
MASNSSLCGGFNANVIAQVSRVRRAGDTVISIGRKMADAMRRDGFPSPEDYTALADYPAYAPAARLVECLSEERAAGHIDRVLLVYNHYVSAAKQVPVVETLLSPRAVPQEASALPAAPAPKDETPLEETPDIILEPGREALLDALVPKTLKLKLFAALLDSAAAEHAARTVAMQTATDNAENLLSELTLQYNKGRQQKITSEILDLAGGQIEA